MKTSSSLLLLCTLAWVGCGPSAPEPAPPPVVEDTADASQAPSTELHPTPADGASSRAPASRPAELAVEDPGSLVSSDNASTDRVDWVQRARTEIGDKRRYALAQIRSQGREALLANYELIEELALARDSKADVRVLCVEILDELDDERSLAPLLEMMEGLNGSLVHTVGRALVDYGGEAEAGLSARLSDSYEEVRFACALALQKIGSAGDLKATSVADLARALGDRDVRVAQVALRTLMAEGAGAAKDALPGLEQLMREGTARGKEAALVATSQFGHEHAKTVQEAALALLEDESPGVRFEAAVLGLNLGQAERVAPTIAAFLRGEEPFWRREAAALFELPQSFAGLAPTTRADLLRALDEAVEAEKAGEGGDEQDQARAAIEAARRAFEEVQ